MVTLVTVREAYEGGTAMGAAQVFPARQLDRIHGLPDRVDGVSVGAITAWARAVDDLDTLEAVWLSVHGASDFQRLRWWWPIDGLYDFTPLARLLKTRIAEQGIAVPCFAHVVDLGSKAVERIPLHDLTPAQRVDAVVASCSQYGIHVAAEFEGRPKSDGGTRHPLPWVPEHHDEVWAVCCSPVSAPWRDNPIPVAEVGISRGLEILLDALQARDYLLLRWLARTSRVWLVEPSRRYGQPFQADASTNRHRLRVVGAEAWQRRRLLDPLTVEEIPAILASV